MKAKKRTAEKGAAKRTATHYPPEEVWCRVIGPALVQLHFTGGKREKYDCLYLCPDDDRQPFYRDGEDPNYDVEECFSVWLLEEVGKPGVTHGPRKHFPPGEYTAHFVKTDKATGLPLFERAILVQCRR